MSIPSPDVVQESITSLLRDWQGSGGRTDREIADHLGLPISVVASVIDLMHATGLVQYTPVRPADVRWRLK